MTRTEYKSERCNPTDELMLAYQEGWDAYKRGRPAFANPYRASKNNEKNLAWNRGWAECVETE